MKRISLVTPCFNEEENVEALYNAVRTVCKGIRGYKYEHIFIDNRSTDETVNILKRIATRDRSLKIIVNSKNFGHIRSPFHGLMQASGDAVILIVADFQDPPEMIVSLIRKWEEGNKIVIGVKRKSRENPIMFLIRRTYYRLMSKISDTEHIKDFTGFGLYDRSFLDVLRELDDPYPYFRGIVAELGFDRCEIAYTQPKRMKGKTKNNFYTLLDMAMTGIVNSTRVPLRIATILGFLIAVISLVISVFYLVYKIVYWDRFQLGSAPMLIAIFFFAAVQLFFVGIIGEYIGAVFVHVRKRPRVIEKERINF